MSVRRLFMSATTQKLLESYGCDDSNFTSNLKMEATKASLKLVPTYKTTALNHNPQNFTYSLDIRGHNYINRSYIDMYLKSIITHMGQNTTHTQISVSALHCPPTPGTNVAKTPNHTPQKWALPTVFLTHLHDTPMRYTLRRPSSTHLTSAS